MMWSDLAGILSHPTVSVMVGFAFGLMMHWLIGRRERRSRLEVARTEHFLSMCDELAQLSHLADTDEPSLDELDVRLSAVWFRLVIIGNQEIASKFTNYRDAVKNLLSASTEEEKERADRAESDAMAKFLLSIHNSLERQDFYGSSRA